MRQILTREWQRFKGRCIYSSAGLVLAIVNTIFAERIAKLKRE